MNLRFTALKRAKQVMAWFLRKSVHLQWIQVLMKPIQTLNDDLALYKDEVIYNYHKDYETIAFESFLNDEFDNSQRRINITHDDNFNQLIQPFLLSENQPLPATYLLSEEANNANVSMSDIADTYLLSEQFPDEDFIVEVPQGAFTASKKEQIRLTVKKYKLVNVNFKIIEV